MKRLVWVPVLALFLCPSRASGVIEVIPTLGQVIRDATNIVVLEVEKVSLEKQVVIYKKVADLKGQYPLERVRHQIGGGINPREPKLILDWAVPGRTAVWFHDGKVGQTCIGNYWYETYALPESSWWSMLRGTGYFCSVYYGSAEKLRRAVTEILEGKEVVITMSSADGQFEYYRGAELKNYFRAGQFNVYRLRASMNLAGNYMPLMVAGKLNVKHGASGPEDVPKLVDALKAGDARARAEAADDLWLSEKPAKDAVGALKSALQDSDALVRLSAARALARSDPSEKDGLAALTGALKDPNASVRRFATEALGSLGKEAKAALQALLPLLKDDDAAVRWSAIDTLGQFGPEAQAAVSSMVDALKDPYLRGVVLEALGEIGPSAKPAAPAILEALKDPDRSVSRMAAIALLLVGSDQKAAARVLVERIRNAEEHVSSGPKLRNSGALGIDNTQNVENEYDLFSLCRYFSRTPGALSAFAEVMIDVASDAKENVSFRRRCAFWLPHVAAHAPKASLARLRSAVEDQDELVRLSVAGTLLVFQPDLEATTPEWAELLQKRAQVGGKYSALLKRIKAPRDYEHPQVRLFCERGFSEKSFVADQKDVPKGHWVYVYPYWFIWGEARGGK